jgi:hypothetical protein
VCVCVCVCVRVTQCNITHKTRQDTARTHGPAHAHHLLQERRQLRTPHLIGGGVVIGRVWGKNKGGRGG